MPILGLAGRMGRKTMEEPQGLALVPGERTLREIYVKTRDARIRGFQWMGSGREGKLVLTTWRLFYCFYDEKAVAFAIEPRDVEKMELIPAPSFFPRPPKIVLTCRLPRQSSSRLCTFAVPADVSYQEPAGLGMMRSVSYANPSTAADFVADLVSWKASGGAADVRTREDIGAQRRRLVETELLAEGRNAIVRLLFALPFALVTFVAPIFGVLALRDARRLRAQADGEGVPVPPRIAWVSRLGSVWIVLGSALWLLMVFVYFHGPIVNQ
ncbi:MAG TPA: hypothetical protein VHL58_06210 [Thermoanaerobaculia bacterium]|nr:hypothetical protein [Thermoanaerobaculia bacterium]